MDTENDQGPKAVAVAIEPVSNAALTLPSTAPRAQYSIVPTVPIPSNFISPFYLDQQRESCLACKTDRKGCLRTVNHTRCNRCVKLGYFCNANDEVILQKRRKVNKYKCADCRCAKQKCEPTEREWPATRCGRCIKYNLLCSAPQAKSQSLGQESAPKDQVQVAQRSSCPILPRMEIIFGHQQPQEVSYQDVVENTCRPIATNSVSFHNCSSSSSAFHTVTSTILAGPTVSQGLSSLDGISPDTTSGCYSSQTTPKRPERTPVFQTRRKGSPSIPQTVPQIYSVFQSYCQQRTVDQVYKNCPLDGNRRIRLIVIHPGSGADIITASFTTTTLGSQMLNYEALSYEWGSPGPKREVLLLSLRRLDKKRSLRDFIIVKMAVMLNLYEALIRLRDPFEPIILWVDAICVDYRNAEEINSQLSLLTDVFYHAQNVCVWVGESTQSSQRAIDFIPNIINAEDFDDLVQDERRIPHWSAFIELMGRPWFSRRWVIQELALARNASLHCGAAALHWADFSDAVALFGYRIEQIYELCGLPLEKMDSGVSSKPPPAVFFLEATKGLLRRSETGLALKKCLTLEALVSNFSSFEVTVPHDVVYALLGLASDSQQMSIGIAIDYQKPVLAVCQEFISFCIISYGSLDMICRDWLPSIDQKLPSWATRRGTRKEFEHIDGIPEVLVGKPGRKVYNASDSIPVNAYFMPVLHSQHSQDLIVSGIRIDSISILGQRENPGGISRESLAMGGWSPPTPNEVLAMVPSRLWRTLVADRGAHGTSTPLWYHRACMHALAEGVTASGDLNIRGLLEFANPSSFVVELLHRVQNVIRGRRFFRTPSNYFGLAPAAALPGDCVSVLFGCSVPVVLREHRTKRDIDQATAGGGGTKYFELIGECYVDGMMDGQAVELDLPLEVFAIR